jgi:hypothetical protein
MLSAEQIGKIAGGAASLDAFTRMYIHQSLSYRFAETNCFSDAIALEDFLAKGRSGIGKPLLNPRR